MTRAVLNQSVFCLAKTVHSFKYFKILKAKFYLKIYCNEVGWICQKFKRYNLDLEIYPGMKGFYLTFQMQGVHSELVIPVVCFKIILFQPS